MTEPKVGARGLACPSGRWVEMTITRCHDDGTFDLMPVAGRSFLDAWEAVTRDELSLDDRDLWPPVFDRIRGEADTVGIDALYRDLAGRYPNLAREALAAHWRDRVGDEAIGLDTDALYAFLVGLGIAAKSLARPADVPERWYRLYWNHIRMGGRDPSDVGRSIGLSDALVVLGLDDAGEDPVAFEALGQFEAAHGTVPAELGHLWTRAGTLAAMFGAHPNAPEPQRIDAWLVRPDVSDTTGRALAVRIMLPHQGDHAWWSVFDEGGADAEIWLSFEEDGPPTVRVADTVSFFWWDLGETGRCWKRKTGDEHRDAGKE